MTSVFYVTNTSIGAAFRFAHPRWHEDAASLYVLDYCSGSGKVLIYDDWQGGRPPKPTRTRPLTNYSTLADLYSIIIAIGRAEPGSVAELHFFTHGDPSCGIVGLPRGECTKAEFNRVLAKGSARGDAFSSAFTASALLKLWGCAGIDAAKRLTLGYWKTGSAERRRTIQQRVESYIRGMYAFRLSFLLDQTVWTTPPGWSSAQDLPPKGTYSGRWDPEDGPAPDAKWWRVSPQFVFGQGAEFYREVLKARIDPVGYVGINDAMSQAPEPAEFIKVQAPGEEVYGEGDTYPA